MAIQTWADRFIFNVTETLFPHRVSAFYTASGENTSHQNFVLTSYLYSSCRKSFGLQNMKPNIGLLLICAPISSVASGLHVLTKFDLDIWTTIILMFVLYLREQPAFQKPDFSRVN